MEVRLLSVGARGFFLAASRLDFAASPLNSVAPNEKKTSGTQGTKSKECPGIRIPGPAMGIGYTVSGTILIQVYTYGIFLS